MRIYNIIGMSNSKQTKYLCQFIIDLIKEYTNTKLNHCIL